MKIRDKKVKYKEKNKKKTYSLPYKSISDPQSDLTELFFAVW